MNRPVHTTSTTTPASSPGVHLGRLAADAWTLTQRELQHWQAQPGPVIVGWIFPVMIVLMFGFLFGGALEVPAGADYFEFLMPGMFTMTMLFGLETTMIAVTTDAARGITDRFRSMPLNAAAVVLGRCIADMLNAVVGLAVMIGVGLLLGWRWNNGLGAALLAVGLLLLLRLALLWLGIFMGLKAKGPESVTAVQILVWPISFLSNILVDPTTMPAPLRLLAQWNPISATTSAVRQLFMNPGGQGDAWIVENAIPMAIVWPLLLIAVFLPLSAYTYRQLKH